VTMEQKYYTNSDDDVAATIRYFFRWIEEQPTEWVARLKTLISLKIVCLLYRAIEFDGNSFESDHRGEILKQGDKILFSDGETACADKSIVIETKEKFVYEVAIFFRELLMQNDYTHFAISFEWDDEPRYSGILKLIYGGKLRGADDGK